MHENTSSEARLRELLRSHGFRGTEGRVALLELLQKAHTPLSIQQIGETWLGTAPNPTTLYRTLADLAEKNIVRRVDFNTGTAHFEYTPDHPHHHHVVCNDCGAIEDIEDCSVSPLQTLVLKNSKRFKNIYSHNLDFFGQCTACANA